VCSLSLRRLVIVIVIVIVLSCCQLLSRPSFRACQAILVLSLPLSLSVACFRYQVSDPLSLPVVPARGDRMEFAFGLSSEQEASVSPEGRVGCGTSAVSVSQSAAQSGDGMKKQQLLHFSLSFCRNLFFFDQVLLCIISLPMTNAKADDNGDGRKKNKAGKKTNGAALENNQGRRITSFNSDKWRTKQEQGLKRKDATAR
jgi:hypothetical protein